MISKGRGLYQWAFARDPKSQKVMLLRPPSPASIISRPTPAPHSVLMATPARRTPERSSWVPRCPRRRTRATARSAPRKAAPATGTTVRLAARAPVPRLSTAAAPRAAPPDTPRRAGSARGFRRRAWRSAPARARAAPTSAAKRARGRRSSQRMGQAAGSSASAQGRRGTGPSRSAALRARRKARLKALRPGALACAKVLGLGHLGALVAGCRSVDHRDQRSRGKASADPFLADRLVERGALLRPAS